MMKRIYLLLMALFNVAFLFGQTQAFGTATYRFKVEGRVGSAGSGCGDNITGGLQWIAIHRQSGSPVTLVQGSSAYPDNGHGQRDYSFSANYDFTKSNKIVKVEYRTTKREKTLGFCGDTDYKTKDHAIYMCNVTNNDFNGMGLNQPGNSTETISTIVQLIQPTTVENMNMSSDEDLIVTLPDNLDNQYYNWEYSIGDNSHFQRFKPEFNNVPILKIKGRDFLTEDDHGKKIYIRVNMACNGSNDSSNAIFFTYYKSAPHILKADSINTTCAYENDGKLILHFDRLLVEGETLEASLEDAITNSGIANYTFPELATTKDIVIDNLPAGKYRLFLSNGKYRGIPTYTDSPQHKVSFTINKPDPVQFSVTSSTNVFCYNGNDGEIKLHALGGTGKFQYSIDNEQTWIDFDNGADTTLKNLVRGTYSIKVRDTNGCFAQNSGATKVVKVDIKQPDAALTISTPTIKTPNGYGLTDGFIALDVTGGTPKVDGSYTFEWRKDSPTGTSIIGTGTVNSAPPSYTIKLDNIGAGKYYLTVTDENYDAANSSKNTCSIISYEFEVTQPDPLVVDLQLAQAISCNIANKFSDIAGYDLDQNGIPDFAEDGKLKANVTGGVLPYSYKWSKEVSGVFQEMTDEKTENLNTLTAGRYKVDITDKNGNITNQIFDLKFPDEMKLSLFANTIKCNSQNEGEVWATLTGGTGPYTYQWSTGDSTAKVTGLDAGNYYLIARDAKNCPVDGNIEIVQPAQLLITEVSRNEPSCSGAADGAISIKVSGGEAPYLVTWSNGMTGENITGLAAGKYTVKFEDKNGCFITKEFTLTSPNPLIIDLGKDITLCSGDSKIIDAKIDDPLAKYVWTDENGKVLATTSAITLINAGTYRVTVTNANGCSGSDDIVVKNSTEVLQPNFLVTTYAFTDKVIEVINTSYVKPEKMEWVIPAGAEVVSKTEALLQIKFKDKGAYKVGLQASQGACEKLIQKEIIVEENDYSVQEPSANASNIKSFVITPNPNSGQFQVLIELNKEASVRLRTLDMQSREVSRPVSQTKNVKFDVPFNTALPGATYLIILETGNEIMVKKMIVK